MLILPYVRHLIVVSVSGVTSSGSRRLLAEAAEAPRLAPFAAVARVVTKYRIEHVLTQRQLAERIRTSVSAVSCFERPSDDPA
jgi:hypothetical protein